MSEPEYGYDEKGMVEDEEVTFTIKCTMRKRWAPQFVSMLRYMQYLGHIGSSRCVSLFSDGDGDFRPDFEIYTEFPEVKPYIEQDGNRYYDAG